MAGAEKVGATRHDRIVAMKTEPPYLGQPGPAPSQVLAQVCGYIDKHGWDVADDEERWRQYQQARMAEEYRDDEW